MGLVPDFLVNLAAGLVVEPLKRAIRAVTHRARALWRWLHPSRPDAQEIATLKGQLECVASLRRQLEEMAAHRCELEGEIAGLRREFGVLTEYQQKASAVVPWLTVLFDIRSDDTGQVIRALTELSRLVTQVGDGYAQQILFEIDRHGLASSDNAEVRRKVFQVRGAAAGKPIEAFRSVWVTLAATLKPLLGSDNPDVSEAACVELSEHFRRLSGETATFACELRLRLRSFLLSCLDSDIPGAGKSHLLEAITALRSDSQALKEAFHLAVEVVLAAPNTLGIPLIRLLLGLGSEVLDVDYADMRRLTTNEEFFDHHLAAYTDFLVATVFAPFEKNHMNGRSWRRIDTTSAQVSCRPLAPGGHGKCACQPSQISFGGLWCPECSQDFDSPLVLQRYEGSRKPRRPADGTFQEPDSWKETKDGRRNDSEDQARVDTVPARF